MSEYIHPYSLRLIGRSGQDRVHYRDYLQSKSLVTDVTASVEKVNYSISESSREMIGTLEQLHERGYEMVSSAIADLGGDVRNGFEGVSWQLSDITGELTALNAKFDWGFSQMIAGIGRVNDSLQELIAVAKTPAETWAYNQYEIARDAVRRELYPEAVEALQRAINGHGDHVGYKLEYRFHYTLGILFLGDVTNTDPVVLDLAKSEASFLTAARYAKADYPMEASVALSAAGWAAYCQGKLPEAENHTKQAIAIHTQNSEALYQLAKIQMHTDRPKEAVPNLHRAAKLDPDYTVRAATDQDFLKFESDLQLLIDVLRSEAKSQALPSVDEVTQVLEELQEWKAGTVFKSEMKLLFDAVSSVEQHVSANTFFGFLEAKHKAERVVSLGRRLAKEQQKHLATQVNDGIDNLLNFRTAFEPRGMRFLLNSFKEAEELLMQVEKGVRLHSDYTRKMGLLNRAREQFQIAIEDSRKQIQRQKSDSMAFANLSGAIVGIVLGFIPAFFVTAIIAQIAKGGESVGLTDPLHVVLLIPCLMGCGFIGAAQMRKKSLVKHDAWVQELGSEPGLPFLGETQRPSPVFKSI